MSAREPLVSPRLAWVDNGVPMYGQAKDERSGLELVRDTERRLRRLRWGAGAVGAVITFQAIGFLIPIFLDPDERWRLGALNAPFVLAYVLAAGVAVNRLSRRRVGAALGWIIEGRPPDEHEHRLTLGLTTYGVKLTAAGWVLAGLLFSVFNGFAHSWEFAAVVAGTIWLGGETTSALVFLVSERTFRPITARALAARPPSAAGALGVRDRLIFAWMLGTGVPLVGVLVVGVVGLTKSDVDTEYVAAAALFLGAVATGVGLLASVFAARAIADPVTIVRRGLERIESGDLDARVEVDDGTEVGLLQAGFNRMAEGLRERERIRDLFGRQVGEDVAHAALRDGVRLGGEEREIGALFIDLVGSTSMAMAMPPSEVVRVLNRFFRIVVEVVERSGGLVNKFEGDAALCVFGAPVGREDPAGDALRCARELAAQLSREVPEVDFGVGISAGTAVAGNVGAENRFEYTVIGDPVNEAARLSELAKDRPERVLASEAALGKSRDGERESWDVTDSALLRGRSVKTGIAHPRG